MDGSPQKNEVCAVQHRVRLPHKFWSNGPEELTYTAMSWVAMLNRVLRGKPDTQYKGMYYDPSWLDFYTFLHDMGVRPKRYTLDRIDNNKGYFKENCRWADYKTQAKNQRRWTEKKNG